MKNSNNLLIGSCAIKKIYVQFLKNLTGLSEKFLFVVIEEDENCKNDSTKEAGKYFKNN